MNIRSLLALMVALASVLLAPALRAAEQGLTGVWRGTAGGQAVELHLRADATGSFNGQALQYQVAGRQILVSTGGTINAYAFELKGDRLTVAGGDLDAPLHLTRGKAGAAEAKPAKPASAGSPAQELEGKWCYVASFSATSGGGSQTSECFVLHPDGRYEYGSERSMSAYAGGAYGGTASQSADAGRWTATATSITARSNSGSTNTYALRKQNHPKNRDPMLCLNDRCYVTYYKKAPW